jgi:periplasmic divalent cation tolerance protein
VGAAALSVIVFIAVSFWKNGRIVRGLPMQDCKDLDILTVTTTVGSLDDAKRLARDIVERHLAACVQLEPIAASLYQWEGRLCEDPEVRLSIKTLPHLRSALEALFAEAHPYELPQFLCETQAASAAYAAWVRGEVEA